MASVKNGIFAAVKAALTCSTRVPLPGIYNPHRIRSGYVLASAPSVQPCAASKVFEIWIARNSASGSPLVYASTTDPLGSPNPAVSRASVSGDNVLQETAAFNRSCSRRAWAASFSRAAARSFAFEVSFSSAAVCCLAVAISAFALAASALAASPAAFAFAIPSRVFSASAPSRAVSVFAVSVCNSSDEVRHSACLSRTPLDQNWTNKNITVAQAARAVAAPAQSNPYQETSNHQFALSSRAGSTGSDSKAVSLLIGVGIILAGALGFVAFSIWFFWAHGFER